MLLSTGFGGCRVKSAEQQLMDELRSQGVIISLSAGGRPPVTVEAHGPTVTDSTLVQITALEGLRNLSVENSQVTDAGMDDIGRMTQLEGLNLANTAVTDEGLQSLSALTNLTRLSLRNTSVSGDGLRHLAGMRNLLLLDLSGTAVTDDDLRHLAGLSHLSDLILEGAAVTGSGLAHLSELPLHAVRLGGPLVGDAGLESVTELPRLEVLTLTNCPNVSDAWVNRIPRSTSLRALNLIGTQVSEEAVENLQTRAPDLTVRMMPEAP